MKTDGKTRLGIVLYKTSPRVRYRDLLRGQKYKMHPWINLSGQWLQDAGFHVVDPIIISVLENKLIISKIKTETKEKCKQLEEQMITSE
jgi:hypothetical protein